jgi:DNA-binding CsgD family transcriptional regulator
MAERLYLSINTIKYHIKHLYDKLQVGSRTQLMSILGK